MYSTKTKWLFLALCLGFSHFASAQLSESDTARFQIKGSGTGVWQLGNVDLLVLRGNLEVVSNTRRNIVFKSQNNSLYQAFSGFKADNDIFSRNYLYWKPNLQFYPFAMLYAQTNYRRAINWRVFGGAGYTWHMVHAARSSLKLSASAVYEQTRFNSTSFNEVAYNGSKDISLWRATVYAAGRHTLFHGHATAFYSAYWQPGIGSITNQRFQLDAGADLPLWKGLFLTLRYLMAFEQVVAQGIVQTDRLVTFGAGYSFKSK